MNRRIQIIMLALLWLVACVNNNNDAGGGGGDNIDPNTPSIRISPDAVVLNEIGGSRQLAISASDNAALTVTDVIWQSSDAGVITVDENGLVTAVSEGEASVTVVYNSLTDTIAVAVNTTAYTLSGVVYYTDKQYATGGFTGKTVALPVRFAVLELLDSNGQVLQTAATDTDGGYQLGPFLDPFSRVRVLSLTDSTAITEIRVTDYDGSIYAVSQSVEIGGDVNAVMDVTIDSSNPGGAFNILDVLTYATQFINENSSSVLPSLRAVWRSGASSLGTYFCQGFDGQFCPQGSAIYLLGGGSPFFDSDDYDDDVVWHEFSHYLEYHFNIAESPGGSHAFTDNDLDLRLAWSEGFGDFFPTAVKAWLKTNHPAALSTPVSLSTSVYVDTAGSSASLVNIGNPGTSTFIYASSEIAVANIMDQLRAGFGMAFIWAVYENQLPLTVSPINLESFWDGWLALHNPDPFTVAQLQTMYGERQVYYREDGYEDDDAVGQANTMTVCPAGQSCSGETHYLYKDTLVPDSDLWQFSAAAGSVYVIETYDLSNGADTLLRVYDDTGQLLEQNDDRPGNLCCLPNDGLTLSSLITFTAPATADYTIEVLNTDDPSLSAGRYGTYSIKVTEQ